MHFLLQPFLCSFRVGSRRQVCLWQSPSMCYSEQQQTSQINYPQCPLLFQLPSRKLRQLSGDLTQPWIMQALSPSSYLCKFLSSNRLWDVYLHLQTRIEEKHFFTFTFASNDIEQIIFPKRPFEVPDDEIDKAVPKISLICSSIKKIMKARISPPKSTVRVPGLID